MPNSNEVKIVIGLLDNATREPTTLSQAIKKLQTMVWDSNNWESELSASTVEILRDLAYDLDYYEPDVKMRAEEAAYFGEDRALEEIRKALGLIAVK